MMWYEMSGREKDVVVSSRIRLARNLEDYPFDGRLDEASAKEVIQRLADVFSSEKGYVYEDFLLLGETEKRSLCEKHLVSPEFVGKKTPHGLFSQREKSVYVMALEEDHVRIQCIMPGLELEEAYRRAVEAEEMLDGKTRVAYSDRFGYLTHCPTNLGTGLRASVMMFLPALTESGQIRPLEGRLAKMGLTIRGMSGEGSSGDGQLYQISNQVTLGISEEETLSKLADVVAWITENERKLRQAMLDKSAVKLRDRVKRAYGTLLFAELLSTRELLSLYSAVRLGASLGLIDTEVSAFDKLLIEGMPSTLTLGSGADSALARDMARATMAKELLTAADPA